MELFQQMKPLLDQGYNYIEAYSKITGISKRNLQRTAQFKHLKKYGETQGYSAINYSRIYKHSNKHGLYNVRLVKQKHLRTGHHWQYVYGRDKYTPDAKAAEARVATHVEPSGVFRTILGDIPQKSRKGKRGKGVG